MTPQEKHDAEVCDAAAIQLENLARLLAEVCDQVNRIDPTIVRDRPAMALLAQMRQSGRVWADGRTALMIGVGKLTEYSERLRGINQQDETDQ